MPEPDPKGRSTRTPDFFIIGAAKSGTSALYSYMARHPDVYLSEPKEPRFFQLEYERGLDWYWSTYFKGWRGERIVGEAANKLTPGYVAARVHASVPHARLIALLREPVARAYSHWWMYVTRGIEPLSFEDAIARNLKHLERGEGLEGPGAEDRLREHAHHLDRGRLVFRVYLDFGYYADHLEHILALFPREQLRVIDSDALRTDPAAVTRRMLGFVGADPELALGELEPKNSAKALRQLPVFTRVRGWALRSGAAQLVPAAGKAGLRRLLSVPAEVPRIDEAVARRLRDHYAPSNRRLADLLGDEAPAWIRTSA